MLEIVSPDLCDARDSEVVHLCSPGRPVYSESLGAGQAIGVLSQLGLRYPIPVSSQKAAPYGRVS